MSNEDQAKQLILEAFQRLSVAETILEEGNFPLQARKVRKAMTQLHELREGNFANVLKGKAR